MSRERLHARRASFFSLPPCGAGPGRGVASSGLPLWLTPLPAPLRAADLPRKGGGNKQER